MSWLPTALSDFAPAALAAVMIAAHLVLGEPFVGWVLHRRFESAVDHDPRARIWIYRRLLILEWGLVALVAAVLVVAPSVDADAIGLRAPDGVGVWTVVVVLAVAVVSVVSVRALRGGALQEAAPDAPAVRSVGSLLPRTNEERRLFSAVAATAGIAEEIVYRGFGVAVLAAVAPGLPAWALVLLAGIGFGLAHAYQGPAGVLTTSAIGVAFAAVYLESGSLLVPIVAHMAVDLRFLAVPVDVLPDPARPQESGG